VTRRRQLRTDEGWREAVYSECELYRYSLTLCWNEGGRRLLWVMLNPSKATEAANDPTIERCERRARQLGYGSLEVVNLFGLRETSPAVLKASDFPEGTDNMSKIISSAASADTILAAWGVHGAHLGQDRRVLSALIEAGKPIFHLGQTKDGHPRHPLYVSYSVPPHRWY